MTVTVMSARLGLGLLKVISLLQSAESRERAVHHLHGWAQSLRGSGASRQPEHACWTYVLLREPDTATQSHRSLGQRGAVVPGQGKYMGAPNPNQQRPVAATHYTIHEY